MLGAMLFRNTLAGDFRGVFSWVVFAILDGSEDGGFIAPFRAAFVPTSGGLAGDDSS